jgi:metal-responsive CopG/Arc/MetJ family transcriptional regulator
MAGEARRRFSIFLDATTLARLDALKQRLGLSRAEQMRRATTLWLDSMEWPAHADRRGAALDAPAGGKPAHKHVGREPP